MLDDDDLARMAAALAQVGGVRAVVLGGSRARGTQTESSDVDLGVYYDPGRLDTAALQRLASSTSDAPVELAGPGGWGPWVEGGGWLTVQGTPVDWILRSTTRVEEHCARALRGEFAFHEQPGHPLGFLDVSYAGEVALCRPLADPDGVIAGLRSVPDPYPDALRRAFAGRLWQAGFLLDGAAKGATRRDVAFVSLSCSVAAMTCAHAWHAAAGSWVVNEKGLLPDLARLPLETAPFLDLVDEALSGLGATEQSLQQAIGTLRRAVEYSARRLA